MPGFGGTRRTQPGAAVEVPVTDHRGTPTALVFGSAGLTDLAQRRRVHTVGVGREAYNSCPGSADVENARIRVALAWVFGIVAAVFIVLGVVVSPVALGVGIPFSIAAYILWYQASGRLRARVRSRADRRHDSRRDATTGPRGGGRESDPGGQRRRRTQASTGDGGGWAVTREEAYDVLGVSPDADPATVRQAYRDRVKDVHPDRGGDEETFKRVSQAYERLRDEGLA